LVGLWWEDDADGVVGVDLAAGVDDGHDAAAAGLLGGVGEGRAPEMLLEGEEVETGGEEVFAELAGGEREAKEGELVEELGGEEMDLSEVGSAGGLALEVEVLSGCAAVGVVLDAFVGDEGERGLGLLGEAVGGGGGGGEDVRHRVVGCTFWVLRR
jgi:hypothetical protein